MKREISENYGLGNAVIVLDGGKIVDLFIDPPSNANFIHQTLLLKQKYKGDCPREVLFCNFTQ